MLYFIFHPVLTTWFACIFINIAEPNSYLVTKAKKILRIIAKRVINGTSTIIHRKTTL